MPHPLTALQEEAMLERLYFEDLGPDPIDYSEPEFLPAQPYSDTELGAHLDREWDRAWEESERQQELR